jgi:hypothetical protein
MFEEEMAGRHGGVLSGFGGRDLRGANQHSVALQGLSGAGVEKGPHLPGGDGMDLAEDTAVVKVQYSLRIPE